MSSFQRLECWCGGEASGALPVPQYARCSSCRTLRFADPIEASRYGQVTAGESGFYGSSYWYQRVPELHGLPTLDERSAADLNERAPYFLERILRDCPASGRALDLGCAPGALTFLLSRAGFDVTGVEMSPEVASSITKHFGVAVEVGPLERIRPEEYEMIVAIDLVEHLVDPLATLELCRRRLEDDGVLFLQTPCYREEGEEWPMFLPEEHLFLFDEDSMRLLLKRAGFEDVRIEASLFHYDMWVIAAPTTGSLPSPRSLGERSAGRAIGEIVEPLLDAHLRLAREAREWQRARAEIEADRSERLELLERQDRELHLLREDHRDRGVLIERLEKELERVTADQRAKEELIARVSLELDEIEADRTVKADVVTGLLADLDAVEADRQAKDQVVSRLSAELEEVRTDQRLKEELIAKLARDAP